jgi:hypothetical protein
VVHAIDLPPHRIDIHNGFECGKLNIAKHDGEQLHDGVLQAATVTALVSHD